jgi:hypothetical protein
LWTAEISKVLPLCHSAVDTQTIFDSEALFAMIHIQELGGKEFEHGMQFLDEFIRLVPHALMLDVICRFGPEMIILFFFFVFSSLFISFFLYTFFLSS